MRQVILICSLILFLWTPVLRAADAPAKDTPAKPTTSSRTATTPAEAELGKKTQEEIEKDVKLVKDDTMVAKLNAIAADIAPFTQRPDVVYNCKILDIAEINAMAIPGGTIYFTKGLMNAAESDDEIAGVMAHEIAHNSLYHIKKTLEKEKSYSMSQILAVLAAAYVASTTDNTSTNLAEILVTSQMIKQALINGYSTDLETEADLNGVRYLYKTNKYDPLGLYSVILGFKQIENSHAKIDPGYLRTHPDAVARQAAITKELDVLHVPINIFRVVNFRAKVIAPTKDGEGYTLQLGSDTILTYTAPDGKVSAQQRASDAVEKINRRLTMPDTQIQQFDVRTIVAPDGTTAQIRMRNTVVMTLIQADADKTHGETLDDLADRVKQNIQSALFHEKLKREM